MVAAGRRQCGGAGAGAATPLPARRGPQMAAPPPAKLRVLALHGYRQNAAVFRSRLGHLRKGLKASCDFFFLDAPHAAPGEPDVDGAEGAGTRDDPRSWWLWDDGGEGGRPSLVSAYRGLDASLTSLKDALALHAPVHGVLGFSQGATMAALLLAEMGAAGGEGETPRFAILAGAFAPRDPAFVPGAAIQTPTMFIAGDADALVPPARSEELARLFADAAWLRHPGGHAVPTCSGETKQAMAAFVGRFRDEGGGGV
mgnify:CR=1 FL=1